jgi:hypothetical protein
MLLLPMAARAAGPLENVRHARAMLGAEVWSRAVRIENVASDSVYPRVVYALIFEFSGLLWFYTDTNGTQSFSKHLDNLPEEKANFSPLLQDIEPGFVRHEILRDSSPKPKFKAGAELPNGCFIESVAALHERLNRGELISDARLLSFYADTGEQPKGHTILLYETPAGSFVYDPLTPDVSRPIVTASGERAEPLTGDPVVVARAVSPEFAIVHARWVPTTVPRNLGLMASVDTSPKASGSREQTTGFRSFVAEKRQFAAEAIKDRS